MKNEKGLNNFFLKTKGLCKQIFNANATVALF